MLAFRENENDVMIYSPSCHSKALYLLFIQWNMKIFIKKFLLFLFKLNEVNVQRQQTTQKNFFQNDPFLKTNI